MELLRVIDHGRDCALAVAGDNWVCGVKAVEDVDAAHLLEFGRDTLVFRDGTDEAAWNQALCDVPRRLVLVGNVAGEHLTETLAEAERIQGPEAAGGILPALVWTERRGGVWRLMLWTTEGRRCLYESKAILRAPTVAWAGDAPLAACEYDEGGRTIVGLWTTGKRKPIVVNGRRPALVGAPNGRAFLIVETVEAPESVTLAAYPWWNGALQEAISLPAVDDFNFNADAVLAEPSGILYVAWECCPAWGLDERVGLHRDLALWALEPGSDAFRPGPGTGQGRLPIRHEGYMDRTPFNFAPIYPRVLLIEGAPAVACRRFRLTGFKGFGWDTYLVRTDGDGAQPICIGRHDGPPDAAYALAAAGDDLLTALPCCDQRRYLTFAEESAGEAGSGRTWYAENHRVEISRQAVDAAFAAAPLPHRKRGPYVIPPPVHDSAPDPPPLEIGPPAEELQLVWGDLHAHTAYSKCMSGNDGVPRDVLRYERDVLGCRVLCLTEHVEYMTSPEFIHVLDTVEAEAGETHIPLYGIEWSKNPAHHTNFYAIERAVFDRLRAIVLSEDHLTAIYERILAELPEDSVVAIRHMHGKNDTEFGVGGTRVTETHEPAVEWAMEAMQTRGNMMISPLKSLPAFPGNFLDSGARIGLVGGSDHSRGGGPNRFCLTGFWVEDSTPRAIFNAIKRRKTLATANGKIAIWATLEGAPIGEEAAVTGAVIVRASLSSATPLRRATLIRDGEALSWTALSGPQAVLQLTDRNPPKGRHWYSVTAEAEGARVANKSATILAHASPFFVEVRKKRTRKTPPAAKKRQADTAATD